MKDVARVLRGGGDRLLVLDNHENDAAAAAVLNAIGPDAPVSIVLTARRCLVAGVSIVPVVPPLVLADEPPYPRVASLTRMLRSNPLGLEIADALVSERVMNAEALGRWLVKQGVERVRPLDHEDDVPEVALLVALGWSVLDPVARRMLAVLAHMGGDHMDAESLSRLSRAGKRAGESLARIRSLRLVQTPLTSRYTLHATVRHAVAKHTAFDAGRLFAHYVALLEAHPERVALEEGHLFAAMDHAHDSGELEKMLRVERLMARLED
jgi:hypothetical protein